MHGTKLHPETIVASDVGCGLVNRPDGYLYSNTINGVTQIDDAGLPTGLVFRSPGNTLGIALDPTNKQLVYVGLDNTILTVPVGGARSVYSTVTTIDIVDGLTFGPGGLLYAANRSPAFRVTVINADAGDAISTFAAGLIRVPGGGHGPNTVLEPGFVDTLVPAIDELLQASILDPAVTRTCEDGIAADPVNDPCERALKQYTSVLLNLESERLQGPCIIELADEGCGTATLEDFVTELADLINAGECQQALDCAAPVNKAWGISGSIGVVSRMELELSGTASSLPVSTPAAASAPTRSTQVNGIPLTGPKSPA